MACLLRKTYGSQVVLQRAFAKLCELLVLRVQLVASYALWSMSMQEPECKTGTCELLFLFLCIELVASHELWSMSMQEPDCKPGTCELLLFYFLTRTRACLWDFSLADFLSSHCGTLPGAVEETCRTWLLVSDEGQKGVGSGWGWRSIAGELSRDVMRE